MEKNKYKFVVEVELLNPEARYPNYRYNYGSRTEFVDMVKSEIANIVAPERGAKIIVKPFKEN